MYLVIAYFIDTVSSLRVGRPRHRWLDGVRMDLREIGCVERMWKETVMATLIYYHSIFVEGLRQTTENLS
jgi:hypothetical protein